jgi:hypothetical protein
LPLSPTQGHSATAQLGMSFAASFPESPALGLFLGSDGIAES